MASATTPTPSLNNHLSNLKASLCSPFRVITVSLWPISLTQKCEAQSITIEENQKTLVQFSRMISRRRCQDLNWKEIKLNTLMYQEPTLIEFITFLEKYKTLPLFETVSLGIHKIAKAKRLTSPNCVNSKSRSTTSPMKAKKKHKESATSSLTSVSSSTMEFKPRRSQWIKKAICSWRPRFRLCKYRKTPTSRS